MRQLVREMILETRRDVIAHIKANLWRSIALCLMAVIFWVWFFPHAYRAFRSPSAFLDIAKVSVSNAPVGTSPPVILQREIKKNFQGSFVTILRRHDPVDASIWPYCDGERNYLTYTAGRPYPGKDLVWWLGSPPETPCMPEAGMYSLRIEWTIWGFWGLIPLYQSAESDVFYMYDPALTQNITPGLSPLILEGVQP